MRILFVGNRRFVLEELLGHTEQVDVNVIAGTHLHRDPFIQKTNYNVIENKRQLLERIYESDFDLLLSNGLPYILDIENLPSKLYVNIHPSYLPDLRGIDPVLGSIIFKRDAGASSHIMDNGIDTGPLISRIMIPFTQDLKASFLYQLSFKAEVRCFRESWERKFKPLDIKPNPDGVIYFSRKNDTRVIPFSGDDESIIQTVKAFDNSNQGARFFINGEEFSCHDAWLSTNKFLAEEFAHSTLGTIVMVYEDTIVVKRESSFLFLSKIRAPDNNWVGKQVSGR